MITEPEWDSIAALVERSVRQLIGLKSSFFVTGQVTKIDPAKKLVWLKEFADQPVPIIGFDYELKYYDTLETGRLTTRRAQALLVMPKVGQTVLVAREMGSQRLPRCLGVLQGTNWIVAEPD